MNNNQLHEAAVKLLIDRKSAGLKSKDYNQRRREATAALQPILKLIQECFKRGESVGTYTSWTDWGSHQSVTLRQLQRIVEGPKPQKRHHVALKVGMTVKVNDMKVVLTQAMLDLLVPKPKRANAKKPTVILHAKTTGWGTDGTLCHAPLTFYDGITGPSDESSNTGTGKSVTCPKCLEKRAAKSKKTAETRAAQKVLRNDPVMQAWLAKGATV